jgi:L-asparaginase II
MATMFARLGTQERLGDLAPAAARVVRAMLASPRLVAGEHRLDTDVMAATGDVVVKGGAEGLVCAAILPLGLGVAIKASDGNGRRLAPAAIAVLRDLGALDGARDGALRRHERLPVLGGDDVQGAVEAVVRLHGTRRR